MDNLIAGSSSLVKDEKVYDKLSTKTKKFIGAYDEIFNNKEFEVIKKKNKFYFLGADILKILGYSNDRGNISRTLSNNLDSENCILLNNLLSKKQKEDRQLDKNELSRIYVNEIGLYTLTLRSNKPNAKPFQKFVYDLIDQAKKNAITEIKNVLADKNDMILELNKKMDAMTIAYKEHTNKIEDQNRQLLELCKKQDIKLDTIVDKLENEILPDRNIPPSNPNKHHKIAIIKYDKELDIIRGQIQYIDSELTKEKTSLVYISDCPNPIDFVNRLRELILNEELDADFTIRYTKIIRNNTSLKKIKKIFDELIQEQYEY